LEQEISQIKKKIDTLKNKTNKDLWLDDLTKLEQTSFFD
jgi:hypothetical protein